MRRRRLSEHSYSCKEATFESEIIANPRMSRSPRNPNRSRNLSTSKDRAPRDGCRDDPDAGNRFRGKIDRGDGSGEAAVGQPTELRCGKGMRE